MMDTGDNSASVCSREAVTAMLDRMRDGDTGAFEGLVSLVYPELRAMARAVFANERVGHTLQPTALVHEACLKLAGKLDSIQDRRHFFVVAGRVMRQIVADHARARHAAKRGGGALRITLDTGLRGEADRGVDLVELHESLESLSRANELHGRIAELRLFSGLTIEETAETLGISARSVDSAWVMAKAWLRRQLA